MIIWQDRLPIRIQFDWFCFHYRDFVRNSLVTLLEARCTKNILTCGAFYFISFACNTFFSQEILLAAHFVLWKNLVAGNCISLSYLFYRSSYLYSFALDTHSNWKTRRRRDIEKSPQDRSMMAFCYYLWKEISSTSWLVAAAFPPPPL